MILIACEESQAVTIEFRRLGYEAYSCDLLKCSGGYPQWHIQKDVLSILDGDWEMILAFPPCDHLARSGARWWKEKQELQKDSINFFMTFINHPCKYIMVENPIGIMSSVYRKPDQIIQPWMFGHGETKSTCLWLKNLPLLSPTNIVDGRSNRIHWMGESSFRKRERSKTYWGVAKAMAEQWSILLDNSKL